MTYAWASNFEGLQSGLGLDDESRVITVAFYRSFHPEVYETSQSKIINCQQNLDLIQSFFCFCTWHKICSAATALKFWGLRNCTCLLWFRLNTRKLKYTPIYPCWLMTAHLYVSPLCRAALSVCLACRNWSGAARLMTGRCQVNIQFNCSHVTSKNCKFHLMPTRVA